MTADTKFQMWLRVSQASFSWCMVRLKLCLITLITSPMLELLLWMGGRLAFVGHTHKPGVYATINGPTGEWTRWQGMEDEHNRLVMPPKARWIANPGSVGQPRDGNPHASYGIYDYAKGCLRGASCQVRSRDHPAKNQNWRFARYAGGSTRGWEVILNVRKN